MKYLATYHLSYLVFAQEGAKEPGVSIRSQVATGSSNPLLATSTTVDFCVWQCWSAERQMDHTDIKGLRWSESLLPHGSPMRAGCEFPDHYMLGLFYYL